VATYARCGGILINHFVANLPRNLRVKYFENPLRFDRIVAMSLGSRLLVHPLYNGI